MEVKLIMDEVQEYMREVVALYEAPPAPQISLTSLVKACEVITAINSTSYFHSKVHSSLTYRLTFKSLLCFYMLLYTFWLWNRESFRRVFGREGMGWIYLLIDATALEDTFSQYASFIDKKLQARFMFVVVREFFK